MNAELPTYAAISAGSDAPEWVMEVQQFLIFGAVNLTPAPPESRRC